jgi:cystathionine beta-lyase
MEHLVSQRDYLARRLAADLPDVHYDPPEGTYLAWLDFRALGLGDDPAGWIREEARVALFDGKLFGDAGKGWARLNFATSREILDEALDRIVVALTTR